jgi:rubrerythrin
MWHQTHPTGSLLRISISQPHRLVQPQIKDFLMTFNPNTSRRQFMGRNVGAGLSVAAIGLLSGTSGLVQAQSADAMKSDVGILNIALGLEHEAINAYQIGAGSGLMQKPVLALALSFQAHHKSHRDALIATIEKMGARAVAEKTTDEYVRSLNAASITNQADILKLAARLELGAANAYLGVIPSFKDIRTAQVAARLAADETMHWTVLSQALGLALPADALSFGA